MSGASVENTARATSRVACPRRDESANSPRGIFHGARFPVQDLLTYRLKGPSKSGARRCRGSGREDILPLGRAQLAFRWSREAIRGKDTGASHPNAANLCCCATHGQGTSREFGETRWSGRGPPPRLQRSDRNWRHGSAAASARALRPFQTADPKIRTLAEVERELLAAALRALGLTAQSRGKLALATAPTLVSENLKQEEHDSGMDDSERATRHSAKSAAVDARSRGPGGVRPEF